MTYDKPKMTVIACAAGAIKGQCKVSITFFDNRDCNYDLVVTAYDADE